MWRIKQGKKKEKTKILKKTNEERKEENSGKDWKQKN